MITIHVGLHKTGSTSIQAALGMIQHRRDLLIVSPRIEDAWSDAARVTRLKMAADARHVIISDEGILGDMADVYESAGDRLSVVRTALADVPYEVIMYVRPQPDWLSSVYLQLVQQGGTLTAGEFWDSVQTRKHLAWTTLADCVRTESGAQRVKIRAYAPRRDSVEDFFESCGLGTAPRPTSAGIHINGSISAVQSPILGALNREAGMSPDERLRMRRLFQGPLSAGVDRDWSPFPKTVQAEIVEHFRADWLNLVALVGRSDADEAQVFGELTSAWERPAQRFPGTSIDEPAVSAELLRTVRVLAQLPREQRPGKWRRATAKALDRPGDLPRALRAGLRRR